MKPISVLTKPQSSSPSHQVRSQETLTHPVCWPGSGTSSLQGVKEAATPTVPQFTTEWVLAYPATYTLLPLRPPSFPPWPPGLHPQLCPRPCLAA